MNTRLEKELDSVDGQLHALVSRLSKHSQQDLDRKPSEQEWSVMQILVHLRLAEYHSLQDLVETMDSDAPLEKLSLKGKITPKLFPILFKMPVKVKSPERVGSSVLPEKASFWDVTKTWKKQRVELRDYLGQLSDEQLKGQVYQHPVFGKTDVLGMVSSFKHHTERHIKQIDKLLSYYKC